jgi:hypothetical protein
MVTLTFVDPHSALGRSVFPFASGGILRQRPVSGLKLLFAALAFFGAAAAWAVPIPHSATVAAEIAAPGEAGTAILTYAGFQTSTAIIGSNPLNLEITGNGNAPFLRYAMRGGRLPKAPGIEPQSPGAAASRARMIELSYREFATTLAHARAGTVAYRSTAPPPSLHN